MSEPEQSERERNRKIARNESERETVSAVRISSWAITVAVVIGVIACAIVWAWLHR